MAIAVLDIGKTNKKILIYDDDLNVVDRVSATFPPQEIDGVSVEDLQGVTAWYKHTLAQLAKRHQIAVVSITTHGAMSVCVDADGEVCVPPVDYTHEPGGSFHEEFYAQVGDRDALQQSTATLELKALVNVGKAIFFVQRHYPDQFARVAHILLYPQFFGFQLTGKVAADRTYLGCHTYLWDPYAGRYSEVADTLGVTHLLPTQVRNADEVLGTVAPEIARELGLDPGTLVTMGIHDSNASLLPYLLQKRDEAFVLNSTGTWCVAMHPEERIQFADEEIGKSVFYNLSAFGTPVKTTILMAGAEFEHYAGLLQRRAGISEYPDFDPKVYAEVASARDLFILPGLLPGTGQFPDSVSRVVDRDHTYAPEDLERTPPPPVLDDPRRFYAAVNLSLAVQTTVALQRVGLRPGVKVYTEGGFRNNRDYNALLAGLFPESRFSLTGMEEATAFGAALLGRAASSGVSVRNLASTFSISIEPVEPVAVPGLQEYAQAFLDLVQ